MDCELIKITDLKDMLNKTRDVYGNKIAYKLKKDDGKYKKITHNEVRDIVNFLGTALIDIGLDGKRIAIIGENRFEWEIGYLAVVCGCGIVVPLDKSLPKNELKALIEKSEVEAIICSGKYVETLEKLKYVGCGKLKHIISMDLDKNENGIYSEKELIKEGKKLVLAGNRSFIDKKIDPKEMSIMLFTSGTTSNPKIVALSHECICTNLMDIDEALDINSDDVFLSFLPLHHVFECTMGFLFSLYKGSKIVFCDGIRHIVENLNEYKVSVMISVPAIYERIFKFIRKELQKSGKLDKILADEELMKNESMAEKKKKFKIIHDMLGGNLKILICGAAALDCEIEKSYKLLGLNIIKGYGLTETSPVIAIETDKDKKIGSVGKSVSHVKLKIVNPNKEGVGELAVKGKSVMLGYFNNGRANRESIVDGWFHTGDLAKIDSDGFLTICGRKKSVIVLKNGKNIYPEEMENLINKIEGVLESFVFGKQLSDDKNDIKINAKIVFDRNIVNDVYGVKSDKQIYDVILGKIKEINRLMPKYKAIRGIVLTEEPLIKTTTNKIKRQANLDEIK